MNLLIADDHPVVRQGLRQMLDQEEDFHVVGEARNGGEVVDLHHRFPHKPVLILSMYPEDRHAVRVLKAGAAGYLTKETAPEELVRAIRKVAGGGKYVTTALGEKLALELEDKRAGPLHETLSDREYQIMWLIASGKTGREIARELTLSPNTVSTYRNRILRKMKMKSNAELMRYAVKYQLVD
jgi:two-component system invasion response regulator UvrY